MLAAAIALMAIVLIEGEESILNRGEFENNQPFIN